MTTPTASRTWNVPDLIVVADALRRGDWTRMSENDPQFAQLADALHRSKASLSYKMWNLVSAHPAFDGRRAHYTALDKRVVDLFVADLDGMTRLAAALRADKGLNV